jgi:hypothetical protein
VGELHFVMEDGEGMDGAELFEMEPVGHGKIRER